jgi:hypothetical protein
VNDPNFSNDYFDFLGEYEARYETALARIRALEGLGVV